MLVDVPAVYDRTKKQITFKTPPTDDAGACHFAIALDGKTFVEYAEPKFVYYGTMLGRTVVLCCAKTGRAALQMRSYRPSTRLVSHSEEALFASR